LTMPMYSIIPENTLLELNAIFDDVNSLLPDELTVLYYCLIEGSISNNRMQYVLNMHRADITTLLKKMCEKKYLESDNNGRWTTYEIKRKVDTSNRKDNVSVNLIENQSGTVKKVATFEKKVAASCYSTDSQKDMPKKVATSDRKVDTSEKKVATSCNSAGSQTDTTKKVATSEKKVATSTFPFFGKSLKQDELECIILEICKEQYVNKETIAQTLGKSERYIRNKFLPKLLKEGKLEKRYPHTDNHPQQGYKTTEKYAKKINDLTNLKSSNNVRR